MHNQSLQNFGDFFWAQNSTIKLALKTKHDLAWIWTTPVKIFEFTKKNLQEFGFRVFFFFFVLISWSHLPLSLLPSHVHKKAVWYQSVTSIG